MEQLAIMIESSGPDSSPAAADGRPVHEAKPNATKKRKLTYNKVEESETGPASSKKHKEASTRIPKSLEEAGPADAALIKMKGAGSSWKDIHEKYQELSHSSIILGSLKQRYNRISANIVEFTDEDDRYLMESKQEIEESFEREKWAMVSVTMCKRGAEKFTVASLMKRWKELNTKEDKSAG